MPSFSLENKVFIHRIPFLNRKFFSLPSFFLSLRKYYGRLEKAIGEIDIFHSNEVSDFSLSKKMVNAPRLVTIHHLVSDTIKVVSPNILTRLLKISDEIGILSTYLQGTVILRADKIITPSTFNKNSIANTYKVSDSKIAVVKHGVYPDNYNVPRENVLQIKHSLGIDDEEVLLFVGRLDDPRKNLLTLLRVFKTISKTRRDVKLVIVGPGNQDPYRSLAYHLGIANRVIFAGFIKGRDNIQEIYSIGDIFVLPSLLEGCPLSILEAMAAGKPIVASKANAIPEIIEDRKNGMLVDPFDVKRFADAIMFLLENRDQLELVGRRNSEYVAKNFSWSKIARETEKVYKTLI